MLSQINDWLIDWLINWSIDWSNFVIAVVIGAVKKRMIVRATDWIVVDVQPVMNRKWNSWRHQSRRKSNDDFRTSVPVPNPWRHEFHFRFNACCTSTTVQWVTSLADIPSHSFIYIAQTLPSLLLKKKKTKKKMRRLNVHWKADQASLVWYRRRKG